MFAEEKEERVPLLPLLLLLLLLLLLPFVILLGLEPTLLLRRLLGPDGKGELPMLCKPIPLRRWLVGSLLKRTKKKKKKKKMVNKREKKIHRERKWTYPVLPAGDIIRDPETIDILDILDIFDNLDILEDSELVEDKEEEVEEEEEPKVLVVFD